MSKRTFYGLNLEKLSVLLANSFKSFLSACDCNSVNK